MLKVIKSIKNISRVFMVMAVILLIDGALYYVMKYKGITKQQKVELITTAFRKGDPLSIVDSQLPKGEFKRREISLSNAPVLVILPKSGVTSLQERMVNSLPESVTDESIIASIPNALIIQLSTSYTVNSVEWTGSDKLDSEE